MADAATLRSVVESMMTRLLAGGETELAEALVHPDFVNNEADPERRNGPSGAAATSEWLRSCFGKLRYDIHRVFVDGDMAAAYVTMHGTHEGGLPPGIPATHKPFAVKHVHLIRSLMMGERSSTGPYHQSREPEADRVTDGLGTGARQGEIAAQRCAVVVVAETGALRPATNALVD